MHFTGVGKKQAGRTLPLLAFAGALMLALLVLFQTISATAAAPLEARDLKMAGGASEMRVVLNFDSEPDPAWFLLRAPHRLVIDLSETKFLLHPDELKAAGLITDIRYGHVEDGKSRLILTTKGPFIVERLDVLQNEEAPGYRLVIDIDAASDSEFEAALALQAETTGATATPKGDRLGQPAPPAAPRPFTIVIDPGHGGIDGGARGRNGTVEKTITLAFALELKAKLAAEGKYNVHLTREKDTFLRLDERVRIARQHQADLLISIHADTIRLKGIRGATVYTVSDKASDPEAEALAIRENLSDQFAGMEVEGEDQEVADILVDLIRRETHSFSIRFARSLIGELSSTVGLINNPHRFAGFRVLKAPDVPSVLVELGYLSNPKDEAQLRDPDWRGKAAASISNAIAVFAAARSAGG